MNEDQALFVATFGPNKLGCMQDFSAFTGVPEKVRFAVYQMSKCNERYKLVGPGYGQEGAYGNGAIFVYATKAEVIDAAIQWCNVPVLMDVMTSRAAEPKAVPPGGRLCVRCGLPADRDWDDTPRGPEHDHQSTCIAALKAEVARLRVGVGQYDYLIRESVSWIAAFLDHQRYPTMFSAPDQEKAEAFWRSANNFNVAFHEKRP